MILIIYFRRISSSQIESFTVGPLTTNGELTEKKFFFIIHPEQFQIYFSQILFLDNKIDIILLTFADDVNSVGKTLLHTAAERGS